MTFRSKAELTLRTYEYYLGQTYGGIFLFSGIKGVLLKNGMGSKNFGGYIEEPDTACLHKDGLQTLTGNQREHVLTESCNKQ